jgi:hypothetical protein
MVRCAQCRREFDELGAKDRVACISGSIMGDEYIESYFLCAECGVYAVEIYHDRFSGEEDVSVYGPVPKSAGDAKVELIRQCSEPWNKKCRCPAHQTYFGGLLD